MVAFGASLRRDETEEARRVLEIFHKNHVTLASFPEELRTAGSRTRACQIDSNPQIRMRDAIDRFHGPKNCSGG